METHNNGDKERDALSPYRGGLIVGFAFAIDDGDEYYVPLGHKNSPVVSLKYVRHWLNEMLRLTEAFVNHNVKFDAHFIRKYIGDAVEKVHLVDTLTKLKIVNYQLNRFDLTTAAKEVFGLDISPLEKRIKSFLDDKKDYADIPADVMADYACCDISITREIDRLEVPDELKFSWELEQKVTCALFDIECEGMRIDPIELMKEELKLNSLLRFIEEKLHVKLGYGINPNSNDDCYQVLCSINGLPVLGWTESGNPSFDAATLSKYLSLPQVTNEIADCIRLMIKYREHSTLMGMFVQAYLRLHENGILHPSYNQIVRTGRMSCKDPNMQQLSKEAKALIHPKEGEYFLSYDYSQVEFRLIVHYIEDKSAIAAYQANPLTDFHTWVAELCGIPRRPAKNVNFAQAYGAGKGKIIKMLSTEEHLAKQTLELVDQKIKEGVIEQTERQITFDRWISNRAAEVYKSYHDRLPGIRISSRQAQNTALRRGWVKTLSGRRRHLIRQIAHNAFNTVIQGSAADVMKERLVATSARYNEKIRNLGIRQVAVVHDEILFTGPKETMKNQEVQEFIRKELENSQFALTVPIVADCKLCPSNWAEGEEVGRPPGG